MIFLVVFIFLRCTCDDDERQTFMLWLLVCIFYIGATQAIALAYDMIQVGRAERMVVVAGDNASSDNLMPWLGNGFRALGAATTSAKVFIIISCFVIVIIVASSCYFSVILLYKNKLVYCWYDQSCVRYICFLCLLISHSV